MITGPAAIDRNRWLESPTKDNIMTLTKRSNITLSNTDIKDLKSGDLLFSLEFNQVVRFSTRVKEFVQDPCPVKHANGMGVGTYVDTNEIRCDLQTDVFKRYCNVDRRNEYHQYAKGFGDKFTFAPEGTVWKAQGSVGGC
jgi:hypothetical protein